MCYLRRQQGRPQTKGASVHPVTPKAKPLPSLSQVNYYQCWAWVNFCPHRYENHSCLQAIKSSSVSDGLPGGLWLWVVPHTAPRTTDRFTITAAILRPVPAASGCLPMAASARLEPSAGSSQLFHWPSGQMCQAGEGHQQMLPCRCCEHAARLTAWARHSHECHCQQPVTFNWQGGLQGWESYGVPPAASSQPTAAPARSWIHSGGESNAALRATRGWSVAGLLLLFLRSRWHGELDQTLAFFSFPHRSSPHCAAASHRRQLQVLFSWY